MRRILSSLAVLLFANLIAACGGLRTTNGPSPLGATTNAPSATDTPNAGGPTPASPSASPGGVPTTGPVSSPSQSAVGTPTPPGWRLVWGDEFDTPAGTRPDPTKWTYELGDGTEASVAGWGNQELETYTDKAENAATDGNSNLVITAAKADGKTQCYYGPCQFTSARLLTRGLYQVQYGRIETRVRVPAGAGLWPAFWMLGTDIGQVGWPKSGEVDVMEYVGRLPNRAFGTIHGPGYSGDHGFGGTLDLDAPLADDFHVFAVEWQKDHIAWFLDGVQYHEATPDLVAPSAWAFNHPFYLILNVAVGGHFGGPVGAATTFPQTLTVDYVRVYESAA